MRTRYAALAATFVLLAALAATLLLTAVAGAQPASDTPTCENGTVAPSSPPSPAWSRTATCLRRWTNRSG